MISLVFSVLFFSSPGKALLTGKGISRQVTTLRRKYSYLHNDTTTTYNILFSIIITLAFKSTLTLNIPECIIWIFFYFATIPLSSIFPWLCPSTQYLEAALGL